MQSFSHALADVEFEHAAALVSLTAAQRRAFERLALAETRAFGDCLDLDTHLGRLFEAEAARRTAPPANDA